MLGEMGLTPLKGIAKTGTCRSKLSSVGNLILTFTVRVFEAEHLTVARIGRDLDS